MGIYNTQGIEVSTKSASDYPKASWGRMLHRAKWGRMGGTTSDYLVPENTLPAFYLAAKEGSGFECDMQHCSDGVIVMSHNTPLDGTLDGESITDRIDETPYSTVSRVVRKSGHPVYGDIGYARLEDVLKIAYYFGVDIVLENKAYLAWPETASAAALAVVKAGMGGHVMYNGGNNTMYRNILAIDPKALFHFGYNAEVDTTIFTPDHIVRTVDVSVVTDEIVSAIKAEGSLLYIWSVNANNYATAMAFNPDYIEFTDNIDGKTLTETYVASQKFVNADL